MKSNNLIITRIRVSAVVFVLTIIIGVVWWQYAMGPVDEKDINPVVFTVPRGQGSKEIARRLKNAELIRSEIGFYLLVRLFGSGNDIQAGDFRLNKSMDTKTIARELTHGMMDVWVTIPEGLRIEEIATKLTKSLNIPEKEFLMVAEEGYMFPDTYLIPRDATASGIGSMFRENFDKKVTPEIVAEAKKEGLSKKDLVIMASIVEREGRGAGDRPIIAGILLNRLRNDWPLQADATLQYIAGYQALDKTWWKKDLVENDKTVESVFNTYMNPGLPPAPIANPGLEAIRAVAYPETSDYMYYLHDESGIAHYAKTIEEHMANIKKFL